MAGMVEKVSLRKGRGEGSYQWSKIIGSKGGRGEVQRGGGSQRREGKVDFLLKEKLSCVPERTEEDFW